jgi:two-component system, response regulator YesN
MASVLIVDDEQPVVDGLCHILSRERPELRIAGTAMSGIEAIEVARRTEPDIVIIDVRMPGIDGLDALEQIQVEQANVVGILATAYERFDIAQRAVRLGVFDYVVKPISRDRALEAVDGAVRRLEQRGERHGRALSRLAYIQEMLPVAEEIFLRDLARGRLMENVLPLFEHLGVHRPEEWTVMAIQSTTPDLAAVDQAVDRVRFKWPCIAGRDANGVRWCVLPARNASGERLVEEWKRAFMEQFPADKVSPRFVTGPVVSTEALANEYRRIDAKLGPSGPSAISGSDLDPLVRALADGEVEVARSMFASLSDEGGADLVGGEATQLARAESVAAIVQFSSGGIVRFTGGGSPDEVFAVLVSQFTDRASGSAVPIGDDLPAPLGAAVQYIQAHYSESLQLLDVADRVHVSSAYLSQLFGKHLGVGFSDYLTAVRIQRAKELLGPGHRSVKEVSHAVGYRDPNYFSRVFRKAVGHSPSEYLDNR